jgi:hypothetical protein
MKKILIALMLSAIVGFSGMADAKLTKIGTVTISSSALGSSRGGGPGGGAASGSNEYGLIYEDDQGLVWIDYSSSGKEWPDQVSWAAGLNKEGALTYKLDPGISVTWNGEWRLPKTVDIARKYGYDGTTSAGLNVTTSEMGHLYYVSLGNLGYYDKTMKVQAGWGLKNKSPFKNLNDDIYWSNVYSIYPNHAWTFNFYTGSQNNNAFTNSYSDAGLAVRPAKVDFNSAK